MGRVKKLLHVAVTNKNLETQFEIKADKKRNFFLENDKRNTTYSNAKLA